MSELYLKARLAGRDIAIPTAMVEGVVKLSGIVPVPAVPPHISGLFALRSRVLTVVDCAWFITAEKRMIADGSFALVATIDGHLYGLVVDHVEDIMHVETEQLALARGLGGGWERIGNEMLHIPDHTSLLVMDMAGAVNPHQAAAA